MEGIPLIISSSFEAVKSKERGYITLKRIKSGYYVYRQSGIWDPKKKRTKPIAEYLGKITDKGLFIRKKLSAKDDLDNAKAIIAQNGGEIIWHKKPEEIEGIKETTITDLSANQIDAKLLTILSMNARIPSAILSNETGLLIRAVESRRKKIEERYGVRYFAEINTHKLGYLTFIMFVKFLDKRPTDKELTEVAASEPNILFMANAKGDHDLIMYVLAETSGKVADIAWHVRAETALKKYKLTIYLSAISQNYGYLPLTAEFFEGVLAKKVWKKTREKIKPSADELLQREFAVMYALNRNGRMEFSAIDKEHALGKGSARYTYEKLIKTGVIDRVTLLQTHAAIVRLHLV